MTLHQDEGFTLLEVLVSMAIFGIISVFLMQAMEQVLEAQQTQEAVSRMESELSLASYHLNNSLSQAINHPDTSVKYGLKSNETTNYSDPCKNSDYLTFHAVQNFDKSTASSHVSDRVSVAIFQNSETNQSLGECQLYMRSSHHTSSSDTAPSLLDPSNFSDEASNARIIGGTIEEVSLTFYDETGATQNNWDNVADGGLPAAVEYELTAYDPDGNVDPRTQRGVVGLDNGN